MFIRIGADQVSNLGPRALESVALPTVLRSSAMAVWHISLLAMYRLYHTESAIFISLL